jgi:hypothetical protein
MKGNTVRSYLPAESLHRLAELAEETGLTQQEIATQTLVSGLDLLYASRPGLAFPIRFELKKPSTTKCDNKARS